MSGRLLARHGVVREISPRCATIDVGVPCGGCSQAGCNGRRSSGLIRLAASGFQPGDRVRLSLPVRSLTSASLAVFGPPLTWFVLTGFALTRFPEHWTVVYPLGPVLFGCGMVGALAVGRWLGRRAGQRAGEQLALNQTSFS